jgi:hypothetical protein
MNKKYFFTLLVIALFVAACAPTVAGNEAPKDPAQPPALVPVTGASVSAPDRSAQKSNLWSGEILNSDSNSPDRQQNIQAPANTTSENSACTSEDAVEQRQSGCIE